MVEGVPTEEVAPVEWLGAKGVMLPDPKGTVNPVPRDADYPIPTIVGRVRYRGYGCPKEVLSDVAQPRVVESATAVVRYRVGTTS